MKKKLLFILKILLSIFMVGYLLRNTDLDSVLPIVKTSNKAYLFYTFLAVLLMNVGQVVRWYILVQKFSKVSIFKLFRYHLVGIFFQSFLPSTMTVELIKGHQLSKLTGKGDAYGSVIFGKIMGLVLLFIIFIIAITLKPDALFNQNLTYQIFAFILIFFVFLLFLFSKKVTRILFGKFKRFENILLVRKFSEFREILYSYRYDFKSLVLATLVSLLIHLGSILASYFLFKSVGCDISILICMVGVPIITVLLMLPVSINGLGFREGLTLLIFGTWGLTSELNISSSILFYGIIYLFTTIFGGSAYIYSSFQGDKIGKKTK